MVISRFKLSPLRHLVPGFAVAASLFCVLMPEQTVRGQTTIRGTVFNMYRTRPLEAVSVVSTSGAGTVTDSNGHYMLFVSDRDSLIFSYLGRSTIRFPVIEINRANDFDIALHVEATELKSVRIAPRNYHLDSLQNRAEYAKVFDFKKPGLSLTSPTSGLGVGLDLDEIINAFRFNRNRRMLAFQRRLIDEEHDKYIDHRFNRSIIKKITHLDGSDLDSFILKFRPSYEFTESTSDYEFYAYIKLAAREYRLDKKKASDMKLDKK